MLRELEKYISAQQLLPAGTHALLAVSGGADSIFLLHALSRLRSKLKLQLHVGHLNHGLRGTHSAADATFVSEQSQQLGVPISVARANIRQRAQRQGVSLEMAGRDARYAFLVRAARRLAREQGVPLAQVTIITAHTLNDQAETLLLKLCRGAGTTGLSGIAPLSQRDGIALARPLLAMSRDRIEVWLRRHGLAWHEDPSNQDDAFLRNRVRHEVLPLLEDRLNPQVRRTLARTAGVLAADDAWMNEMAITVLAAALTQDGALALDMLRHQTLAARCRVLRLWLGRAGFPVENADSALASRVDGLITKQAGIGRVDLSGGWFVARRYGQLVLLAPGGGPSAAPDRTRYRLLRNADTKIDSFGLRVRVSNGLRIQRDATQRPGKMPACATFSAGKIGRAALYIRYGRAGDRMCPLGSPGTQKLQDIFVNLKVPQIERSHIPVIECRGEIVWIPGFRIAEGWQVRTTGERMVEILLKKQES